jgi:imidazole glycerol-phosphate synthase subunit HisF
MNVRIIARLDIKGPTLVKGVQLEGLRVLGTPEQFARHYYETGADELLYMDIVASLYQRNSLLDIIHRTSREIFIPLTVGGGLRTLDDIRVVLNAGADKVALNTAAVTRPEFIREASARFGSSTIVVSIEAKRRPDGRYEAYTDCGRERTGFEVFDWAERAQGLGAGEIMITSIDREGTGQGLDIELTRGVATRVTIPVIACGGAGRAEHVRDAIADGRADAVAVASLIHYDFLRCERGAEDDAHGREDRLGGHSTRRFSRIQDVSVPALKRHLNGCGIGCRFEASESRSYDEKQTTSSDRRLRDGQLVECAVCL